MLIKVNQISNIFLAVCAWLTSMNLDMVLVLSFNEDFGLTLFNIDKP